MISTSSDADNHVSRDKWSNCTRVGGKVHRMTMMQWSNLTKCGLFFIIFSPAVHTLLLSGVAALGFPWYRSSHPDPQKSPQLQIWPHHRCDTASQPSVFFHVGEQKIVRWCQIRNMEGDQPVQSHSHAQQPFQPQNCVQEHCPFTLNKIILGKQANSWTISRKRGGGGWSGFPGVHKWQKINECYVAGIKRKCKIKLVILFPHLPKSDLPLPWAIRKVQHPDLWWKLCLPWSNPPRIWWSCVVWDGKLLCLRRIWGIWVAWVKELNTPVQQLHVCIINCKNILGQKFIEYQWCRSGAAPDLLGGGGQFIAPPPPPRPLSKLNVALPLVQE